MRVDAAASGLTGQDLWLLNEGRHFRLYDALGSHPLRGKARGARFAVLAPDARKVSVVGDFNRWDPDSSPLRPLGSSGVWEGVVADAVPGSLYKYDIRSRIGGYRVLKADPMAFLHETPPKTASVVWDLDYEWHDSDWMRARASKNSLDAPISVYEVHVGSWRRSAAGDPLTYRELAPLLADHALSTGFTHIEFLPVMEHPFAGSWGYQTTGYFAPSSRFGSPQDFMFLVDHLHRKGLGVILDWVPSHFPNDEHGLAFFDGAHLYEHADPRQGFHPDWKSCVFNYGRREVRSFLGSSALFWLDRYHADGIRVDAVASMLYLDYSRPEGEWVPNIYGGRENLDAISLLQEINAEAYRRFPDIQMIAEESTAWPGVSRPAHTGGLGFGLKWDMGWMHDTLSYFARDPVHRRYHHNELTFRPMYAGSENFLLPLSHDEVVHGKGSLLEKMPGDDWQKFANLRLLLGYFCAVPGKKLLFMGGEFAQPREWDHDEGLDWDLLGSPAHDGVRIWTRDVNALYAGEPSLYRKDADPAGFEWVDAGDSEGSTLAFLRTGAAEDRPVLAAFNFTPVPRTGRDLAVPRDGLWQEVLNSDAREYGGSGMGNLGGVESVRIGGAARIAVTLPPLAAVFFRPDA